MDVRLQKTIAAREHADRRDKYAERESSKESHKNEFYLGIGINFAEIGLPYSF